MRETNQIRIPRPVPVRRSVRLQRPIASLVDLVELRIGVEIEYNKRLKLCLCSYATTVA